MSACFILAFLLATCSDGKGPRSNPTPVLHELEPAIVLAGTGPVTLQLRGAGFVERSEARWNGAARASSFLADTLIEFVLSENDLALAGEFSVRVLNPAPGGGLSDELRFQVHNPGPEIDALTPHSAARWGDPLQLTVHGSGFAPNATIRWGNVQLATDRISSEQLRAPVPGFIESQPGAVEVRVANPAPGGGLSEPAIFMVQNPVAALNAVAPTQVLTNHGALTVELIGTQFAPGGTGSWNGQPRPTQVISRTRAEMELYQVDLAVPGTHQIRFENPGPGGGGMLIAALTTIASPARIASASPLPLSVGDPAPSVTIEGGGLREESIVLVNGQPRASALSMDSAGLVVQLTTTDVASTATLEIVVTNPEPVGSSNAFAVPVVPADLSPTALLSLPVVAGDVVYDPHRALVHVAVRSSSPNHAGEVVSVDPHSGTVVGSIVPGDDPDLLAIAHDGSVLYVGHAGASEIVRIDLVTRAVELVIELGEDQYGPLYAERMEVLQGAPASLVVSRYSQTVSPRHRGVVVFDDGAPRPHTIHAHRGSNRLTRSADPDVFFGFVSETSGFELHRLQVVADGIVETEVSPGLIPEFGADIAYAAGQIFGTTGDVIAVDPFNWVLRLPVRGLLTPDEARGRIGFLDGGTFAVKHPTLFARIGDLEVAFQGTPLRSVRWGDDGMAVVTTERLYLLRSPLFGP